MSAEVSRISEESGGSGWLSDSKKESFISFKFLYKLFKRSKIEMHYKNNKKIKAASSFEQALAVRTRRVMLPSMHMAVGYACESM